MYDESRLIRHEIAEANTRLDWRVQSKARQAFTGLVTGNPPTFVPSYVKVTPEDLVGAAKEGGSAKAIAAKDDVVAAYLGPDLPQVGQRVICHKIGPRWVAESGGAVCPVRCRPCNIPKRPLRARVIATDTYPSTHPDYLPPTTNDYSLQYIPASDTAVDSWVFGPDDSGLKITLTCGGDNIVVTYKQGEVGTCVFDTLRSTQCDPFHLYYDNYTDNGGLPDCPAATGTRLKLDLFIDDLSGTKIPTNCFESCRFCCGACNKTIATLQPIVVTDKDGTTYKLNYEQSGNRFVSGPLWDLETQMLLDLAACKLVAGKARVGLVATCTGEQVTLSLVANVLQCSGASGTLVGFVKGGTDLNAAYATSVATPTQCEPTVKSKHDEFTTIPGRESWELPTLAMPMTVEMPVLAQCPSCKSFNDTDCIKDSPPYLNVTDSNGDWIATPSASGACGWVDLPDGSTAQTFSWRTYSYTGKVVSNAPEACGGTHYQKGLYTVGIGWDSKAGKAYARVRAAYCVSGATKWVTSPDDLSCLVPGRPTMDATFLHDSFACTPFSAKWTVDATKFGSGPPPVTGTISATGAGTPGKETPMIQVLGHPYGASGNPVPDLPLIVEDEGANQVASASTDANGILVVDAVTLPRNAAILKTFYVRTSHARFDHSKYQVQVGSCSPLAVVPIGPAPGFLGSGGSHEPLDPYYYPDTLYLTNGKGTVVLSADNGWQATQTFPGQVVCWSPDGPTGNPDASKVAGTIAVYWELGGPFLPPYGTEGDCKYSQRGFKLRMSWTFRYWSEVNGKAFPSMAPGDWGVPIDVNVPWPAPGCRSNATFNPYFPSSGVFVANMIALTGSTYYPNNPVTFDATLQPDSLYWAMDSGDPFRVGSDFDGEPIFTTPTPPITGAISVSE